MTVESIAAVKSYYSNLEDQLKELVSVPFQMDSTERDGYIDFVLDPFSELLRSQMLKAADSENFEEALAIKQFLTML